MTRKLNKQIFNLDHEYTADERNRRHVIKQIYLTDSLSETYPQMLRATISTNNPDAIIKQEFNLFGFHGNAEDIYLSFPRLVAEADSLITKCKDYFDCGGENICEIIVNVYNIAYPSEIEEENDSDDALEIDQHVINAWADMLTINIANIIRKPNVINVFSAYSLGCGLLLRFMRSVELYDITIVLILRSPFISIEEEINKGTLFTRTMAHLFFDKRIHDYFDMGEGLGGMKYTPDKTSILMFNGTYDNIYNKSISKFLKLTKQHPIIKEYHLHVNHDDMIGNEASNDIAHVVFKEISKKHLVDQLDLLYSYTEEDATSDEEKDTANTQSTDLF